MSTGKTEPALSASSRAAERPPAGWLGLAKKYRWWIYPVCIFLLALGFVLFLSNYGSRLPAVYLAN